MRKKEMLELWFKRVWADEDAEAIGELMAPDAAVRGLEEPPLNGAEAFKLFQKMLLTQLAEVRIEIVRSVEQDDWIAATLRVAAVSRRSGVKLSTRGHTMMRFVDGRIVEGHNLFDFIDLFEQLGHLPERTLDQCLLGGSPRFMAEADPPALS